MILTSNYNLYLIPSYDELYRVMVRDGVLKYVHELGGPDELIIEAYTFRGNASTTVAATPPHQPVVVKNQSVEGNNIIPFPKKPKG